MESFKSIIHELPPGLHVIAEGLLLGFALGEFRYLMPVGRVEFMHLQPMSFEEFVAATFVCTRMVTNTGSSIIRR